MIEWYKEVVFRKYATFDGRARRAEFWYFVLVNVIIGAVLEAGVLAGTAMSRGSSAGGPGLYIAGIFAAASILYLLATLVPSIAVSVRRLHDRDLGGWWYLLIFVPFVGAIAVLILQMLPGTPGPNRFGPDPKVASPTLV